MWLVFAASAAVCFGLRGILYQWTSQRPINRNVMLFGVYVCGMLTALIANLFTGQPWTPGVMAGIFMGVFSFVANAAMYKGFAVGKASLVAIFSALSPVVAAVGAYIVWGETLTGPQLAAFLIILSGIVLIRYSNDLSLNHLNGVQWALLTMLFFGITDLWTKQSTLWGAAMLPTLATMYATGSVLFGLWALRDWNSLKKRVRNELRAARSGSAAGLEDHMPAKKDHDSTATGAVISNTNNPARVWNFPRTFFWGMLVGVTNISGMLLIVPAFRYGITGLVSAVIALNVLIILLYARLVLKEKFRRLEIVGAACTIIGMFILQLLG